METIEIDLGYTHLEIGDQYVIARTASAVDVGLEEHQKVMDIIAEHTHFPIIFIVDEVNSYSIKLETMMALRKERNITQFGVVAYRTATRITHNFGAQLVRKPVNFFRSRMDARKWAEHQGSAYRTS